MAATKEILGFDPAQSFEVPPAVIEHTRQAIERGQAARAEWQTAYDAWSRKPSADVDLYERLQTRTLPTGWDCDLPTFPADEKGMATRKASGEVINAIAATRPRALGRLGRPGRVQQHHHRGRAVVPARRTASARLWKGDPSPAGCCTSASASTPWARS